MREIRLSGSEGGGDHTVSPYPYQPSSRRRYDLITPQLRPLSLIAQLRHDVMTSQSEASREGCVPGDFDLRFFVRCLGWDYGDGGGWGWAGDCVGEGCRV